LGNSKDQTLDNPQSLNAYSYANDNPITQNDPDGHQVPAQLIVLLMQVIQALENYLSSYVASPVGQVGMSTAVEHAPTLSSPKASATQKFGATIFIGASLVPDFPEEKIGKELEGTAGQVAPKGRDGQSHRFRRAASRPPLASRKKSDMPHGEHVAFGDELQIA
jgi:hypothetical protein